MLFIRAIQFTDLWALWGLRKHWINYSAVLPIAKKQLAQAELHLLRSQLHPHFLFNTLHTIAANDAMRCEWSRPHD